MSTQRLRLAVAALCALGLLAAPAAGQTGTHKRCKPVVNPYPNSRYEGSNLHHVRALGVSCRQARRVARGAHKRAMWLPLPRDGVRTFNWRRWVVRGDIRGPTDRYRARRGSDRVRWRF